VVWSSPAISGYLHPLGPGSFNVQKVRCVKLGHLIVVVLAVEFGHIALKEAIAQLSVGELPRAQGQAGSMTSSGSLKDSRLLYLLLQLGSLQNHLVEMH